MFHSDIVLRLWDIIIFNFTTAKQIDRKRALWWLLTPSFFILKTKKEEILASVTHEEIIQIFQSGGSITYDADQFIKELDEMITHIFVEGTKTQTGLIRQLFQGQNVTAENKNAFEFEEQRAKYNKAINQIFEEVKSENLRVEDLVFFCNKSLSEGVQTSKLMDYRFLQITFIEGLVEITQGLRKQ